MATQLNLSSTTTFDAVRFWGGQSSDWTGSLFTDWSIISGSSPSNANIVFSGSVVASEINNGYIESDYWDDRQYDFSTGSITLAAGNYWLGLSRATASGSLYLQRDAQPCDNSPSCDGVVFPGGAQPWDPNGGAIPALGGAFELRNDVSATPDQASITLMATGLVGVFGVTRRIRKKAD
jgi:hypothetical protein